MKRRTPVLVVPLLLAASCARSTSESAPAPAAPSAPAAAPKGAALPGSARSNVEEMDLETAARELAIAEKQLGDTVALAAPDCELSRSLRDRICELSARICKLTEVSAEPSVQERCTDGKQRCERARRTVSARCN